MVNKRKLGAIYEDVAVKYLKEHNYRILERNYRNSYGEIDIIASKNSVIIFTEIKFRTTNINGDPLEAVDFRKQRRISRVAMYYYVTHDYSEDVPCRFDVIAIYGDGTIRHIENAFEYSP
jgi:putative endonuclease